LIKVYTRVVEDIKSQIYTYVYNIKRLKLYYFIN